ncbi:aldehyde dehydrogenase [Sporolactobacillus spathodeae]|uniref:Lactaldehyde dehydrogenase/glycolaldehyde dehydrogenase n=1 Tax=Sporolactobacillus spathodeae TaxID=1465502 RepID=A0ABS2Q632_9BACL|nr:lactaldehyde dehydrogenase/glycolaldehyde dehydrogenase [Sporolactobacillus spathodeae]
MTKKLLPFIDGKFIEPQTEKWIDVVNPATEEILSLIPDTSTADAECAVAAAYEAQKTWARVPAITRGSYLHKIADGIRQRAGELTAIIVREGGKTQELANTEVLFTADYLDYTAEWARRYEGEIIQSDRPNENILLFKKPIGVIAGILPWNFPFFLIARKAGPALVTGNTIVIKPSQQTPENAYVFSQIVEEAGLPKGVFNMVPGRGSVIGQALAENDKVGMISLTGSVPAGQRIMETAAKNITKVSLELGGKAPAIVMDDADLDLAVKAIVASRVINTGQVCNCAERVYVHKNIKEAFTEKLIEAMQLVKYGNPSEIHNLDMGPLIEKAALENVTEKVNRAVNQGAILALGGKRASDKGYFFEPTVLTHVTNEMDIMHEETFGPVIPVAEFATLDEAIELANDSDFGLTSSIYTKDLENAFFAIRRLHFGETYINRENFEAMQGFHAGWKKSGIGGADGKHGLEEYLQTHVVYLETSK